MSIELHYTPGSGPCRAVRLVAASLNLDLKLSFVNMMAGANREPAFLKLNPQHTIPTLVDGNFSLWESRAIIRYLVNKYGPNSTLYPQDPQTRALIDQRLDFDLGTLYARFEQYFFTPLFGNTKPDEAILKKLEEALGFLNTFLEGQTYTAGSKLTIADLSLVTTVSTIEGFKLVSLKAYPNVEKWFELVKRTAPQYDEINQKGVESLVQMIAQFKASKK